MYKLLLKKRPGDKRIVIPSKMIDRMKGMVQADLLKEVAVILENGVTDYIHDATWLQMIVNWSPENGTPLTEAAKWMKLAVAVNRIDEDKECSFTLTPFQVNLIWGRLTDQKFKMASMPIQFIEFLTEFQAVTGRHFQEEDPGGEAEVAEE